MPANIQRWVCAITVAAAWAPFAPTVALGAEPVPRMVDARPAASKADEPKGRSDPPDAQSGSVRKALVIGNSAYDKVVRLPNAKNDARDVCAALGRLDFKAACFYDVPSRRAFREIVQNFVKDLGPGQTVLIYFAGHGAQSGSENYLLPTNVDPRSVADIEEDGLSLTYLLRALQEARSGPNVVIVDACRENLLTGRLRGLGRGLAAAEPPADTLLVYATAPNENALDSVGDNSPNGLFAKHLLARMEEPGLMVDQLFAVVAESVWKEANDHKLNQLPYRNSALSTMFCLGSCESPMSARSREQINLLNAQLDELRMKYAQREEEVAQLAELRAKYAQREAEIQALQTKNSERDASIARLTSRIEVLQRDSATAGAAPSDNRAELARLRVELDTIQQERQRDAARLEQQNIGRARELAELRAREAEAQRLAQEVESYRRQVQQLQNEKEELQRRSTEPAASSRPRVIVPSF